MIKQIIEYVEKEKDTTGSIFVLKGFPITAFDEPIPNMGSIISNKLGRLLEITQREIKIITFEEFICLYDFLFAQFRKITIIENGLYLNLYPVGVQIPEPVSASLLAHFNEEVDSNTPIVNITEYCNIYSNYIEKDAGIGCCFNITENDLKHEKIIRITLGKESAEISYVTTLDDIDEMINICDEMDYFSLVQKVQQSDLKIVADWQNYVYGKEIVEKKLRILSGSFENRVYGYISSIAYASKHCDQSIYDLLEKYKGFTQFRQLIVYDMKDLEKKKKTTLRISQEDIICDIITEAENCQKNENFRDIFVTAPTGSGKSVMFQLPAIYLAANYNLLTIVVTPLIGLMNDQVQALRRDGYTKVQTINSDIPPVVKQDILEQVADGRCDLLYLSPESLLSRSDIEQLIGKRQIGMLVVDEAHIVTTWGKQFRPDYWYLGDHVQKLRNAQIKKYSKPFIIATFTATAIYEGTEDMYHETLNSLHMIDPITYLGYVRRDNILIEVSEVEVKRNKVEYEMNKFDSLIDMIQTALMRSNKTLIYFPTVVLINRFYDYCYSKDLKDYITRYHGQMDADDKNQNFQAFLKGEKLVMLATKAFGMGIDISDIAIVSHFAPTGNVCDYMQEIGRAARDAHIQGHAIYKHMRNDFKHINKLHGLSAIRKYQLIEVIKKVLELYVNSRYGARGGNMRKKRNEMLVDTENFAYIFEGPQADENDLINKVKTAMLLIQKDYENRGFSPFYIRPIPMFAYGYFAITPLEQKRLTQRYKDAVKLVYHQKNVCEVNLRSIWETSYENYMSFPKFKFLLYTKSIELEFNRQYTISSAMSVEIYKCENYDAIFSHMAEGIKKLANLSIYQNRYLDESEMIDELMSICKVNRYRAESIISVFIASLDIYQKDYSQRMNTRMYKDRKSQTDNVSYQFNNAIREYFSWLRKGYEYIDANTVDHKLYLVNDESPTQCKQMNTLLGILESMGVLHFKSIGGSSSQIYIYVNETKNMQMVRDKPQFYKNHLLDMINKRHEDSVKMLTYLFQNNFSSDIIWDHLENYFLGILPEPFQAPKTKVVSSDDIVPVLFQIGENLKEDYSNWAEASVLFSNEAISDFERRGIPLADYYSAKLIIGDQEINALLAWQEYHVIISSGVEPNDLRVYAEQNGWRCFSINDFDVDHFEECFVG